MELKFNNAKWSEDNEGLWVSLNIDPSQKLSIRKFISNMQGKYKADIKKHYDKRSLDANAYFWVLCDKLSVHLKERTQDIYRELIKDVGGNNEVIPIKKTAVDTWVKNWSKNGTGWVCDILGESKIEGYTNIRCYYGSSTYDIKQMSRLIELLVRECQQYDIEIKTPQEIANILSLWENKK